MTYKYKKFSKEKQLFNFLKKHFIKDLEETKEMERFDCFSNIYKLNIELKCRQKHYNDLILEKKKLDGIIERSNKLSMLPVYINSTPLGIWAFYLTNRNYEWKTKVLPKTTEWNRDTVEKQITYLNINQGIDLLSLLPSLL